jgi:uncharacterized protein involved in outer membrane biogenesis
MRRIALWSLAAIGILAALPVLFLSYAAFVGIPVDAGPWRDRIAAAASNALGRKVVLEGALRMRVSLRPSLEIGGIRIEAPEGFPDRTFASLGDARAKLDLYLLLRNQLRIDTLEASNVHVRLERLKDGRINWAFPRPEPGAGDDAPAPATTPEGETAIPDVGVEVKRLALRNISLEYWSGFSDQPRTFDLDALDGEAPAGKDLRVTLRGRVDRTFPYAATITGGPPDRLYRGTEAWPFALDFEFLDTRLHAQGDVDPRSGAMAMLFGLGTGNLAQLERFLQTSLPKVGVTGLAGRVTIEDGVYAVSDLQGVMGLTRLSGKVSLTLVGERPRVDGDLAVPLLDLRPFLEMESTEPEKPLTFADLEKTRLDLRALVTMDAHVDLHVGEWVGLPLDIRDANLEVRIDAGRLAAPMRATIAEAPLTGKVELDGSGPVPAASLRLGATDSPLGDLARLLVGIPGIQGHLARLDIGISGQGETLGALVGTLDTGFSLERGRLSYGNVEGGRPVEFTLHEFDVRIPRGQALRGTARGTLLGERFRMRMQGGDLPSSLRELRTPLAVTLEGSGAKLQVDGTLARPGATTGTDLSLKLVAPRAGTLARWLGLARDAAMPLSIGGHARVESDEWHLTDFSVRLGRSDITIDAHRTGIGTKPFVLAAVRSKLLDLPEFRSLTPPAKPETKPRPETTRTSIDIPILPQGVDLADADIGIGLSRVVFARGDLTDVGFAMRLREGRMQPSPFGASLVGTPFSGTFALDLRGRIPQASLAMSAAKVDVGLLLKRLGVVEDLDTTVDALRVSLEGRGSTLEQILEQSTFSAAVEGGQYRLRGPTRDVLATVMLKQAVAAADPGKPIALTVDGTLDEVPVAIRLSSGSMPDFVRNRKYVPFSLAVDTSGTKLALDGKVTLPIDQAAAELDIRLSGARLDSLNPLARADLPPWGPWSISGPFRVTRTAYEVPGLELRVGSSRLSGKGRFELAGKRPRLDVAVSAPRIQLDDFELEGWSAFEKTQQAPAREKPVTADELRAEAKEAAAEAQKVLSYETLNRLDAVVDVDVGQVLSGEDRLGSGKLHAALLDGRLAFDPIEVNVPGGSAQLAFSYKPSPSDVTVEAQIRVERFDYGVLARRIKPDSDLSGLFSLDFDLRSRAPRLDAVMAHAEGRIDIAVWPKNLKAGVFDLWAVNVFVAMLPAVDPDAASVVNCAVARFDITGGKLKHDAILIDTSRMRVTGAGGADFAGETLAFRMQPRSKTAQFFSLATPVGVEGTFTDFEVDVAPEDVLGTLGRFFGSIVTTPIELLRGRRMPQDGSDVCGEPMRAITEKRT